MTELEKSRNAANRPLVGSGELIRQLVKNPQLAAYIQHMPALVLSRLIEAIGLEDSQEILALVNADQLKDVLSISVWRSQGVGQNEVLDIDQFVRWLEILLEDERTLVPRLIGLGEDFIVACLAKLIRVFDQSIDTHEEAGGVSIDNYQVFPKTEKHWHIIVEVLLILSQHALEFALRVLGRCNFAPGILRQSLSEQDGAVELVEADLTAERATTRSDAGYADPIGATIFLMTSKTRHLEDLVNQQAYDINTAAFLRKQRERLTRSVTQAAHRENVRATMLVTEEVETPEKRSPDITYDEAANQKHLDMLDSLLRDVGVLVPPKSGILLVTADARHEHPPSSALLQAALASLMRTTPDIASQRMAELAYLSNVLMSGATIQGKTFSEVEAAQTVSATTNLGATYLAASWGVKVETGVR